MPVSSSSLPYRRSNPRTGVVVSVAETTVPLFRTGKEMRGRLNRGGIKRRT